MHHTLEYFHVFFFFFTEQILVTFSEFLNKHTFMILKYVWDMCAFGVTRRVLCYPLHPLAFSYWKQYVSSPVVTGQTFLIYSKEQMEYEAEIIPVHLSRFETPTLRIFFLIRKSSIRIYHLVSDLNHWSKRINVSCLSSHNLHVSLCFALFCQRWRFGFFYSFRECS